MNRVDILSLLETGKWAISVHEHIGQESLVFENGIVNDYRQTIGGLFKDLSHIDFFGKPVSLASVVLTMPHIRFSVSGSNVYHSYASENLDLLKKCVIWSTAHPYLMPLPFLSAEVSDDLSELEKQVMEAEYPVMGIKFHPRARNFSLDDLLHSGLLHFAARMKLPVLMHCTGQDQVGGLQDIFDNKFPEIAAKLDLKLCIAHAGFLDEDIIRISEWPGIFTDVSPWSVLTDSVLSFRDFEQNVARMVRLIKSIPDRVLYGGDTPFDRIKWTDGKTYGLGRDFDLSVLKEAIKRVDSKLAEKIFFYNPIDFLS